MPVDNSLNFNQNRETMKPVKRLIIATLGGLLFGIVCYTMASMGPEDLPYPVAAQIISSRILMGFAIGLSRFDFGHWAIHGIVLGTLFSLPLAYSGLMAPENPDFTPIIMFVSTMVMGAIYGLLIEVITSAIFRAKAIPKKA